ncbi:MAG: YHS domain-containing (seleno)protein [Bacteroidota bacterium]|uniref:YHS domain-containing (Seleno)protein n=1 Tax=Flagellimonas okinawensis TaxID=3031324 RepID=A0ABT5XIN6_9FLAO|nr:YHS domain-containing (seleno)protein [[Muricauda] okinawensis]MDF0705745.1 YHS domain-containing (seleno)protein [[Muricauda] okinawensis]MEC8832427.1 YHS domain-containing (seleno)protein [Bacteroidota bacterium]
MKTIKNLFLFGIVLFAAISAQAQTPPVDDNGLAIGGYDVVSYFSGEAQKGSKSYAVKHSGATYYFASKANQTAFKKSPNNYLPQFDGYCAWGIGAKEVKFPINPETYTVIDGKLYLFFNGPFNGEPFNTYEDWGQRTTELKKAAHANWPKVRNSK